MASDFQRFTCRMLGLVHTPHRHQQFLTTTIRNGFVAKLDQELRILWEREHAIGKLSGLVQRSINVVQQTGWIGHGWMKTDFFQHFRPLAHSSQIVGAQERAGFRIKDPETGEQRHTRQQRDPHRVTKPLITCRAARRLALLRPTQPETKKPGP